MRQQLLETEVGQLKEVVARQQKRIDELVILNHALMGASKEERMASLDRDEANNHSGY